MNIICLINCCCIMALLNAIEGNTPHDSTAILLIFFFSLVYLFNIYNNYTNKTIGQLVIVSYLMRLCIIVWDIYCRDYYILPNSGDDTEMFYWNAIRLLNGGETSRGMFVYIVYFVFLICGPSRLWIQFLIMLCSMVTLHFIYQILVLTKINEEKMTKVMMVSCLLPNFSILSCILSRESIVCMFMTISLFYFISWIVKKQELPFLYSLIFAFVPIFFHGGMISIPIAYMFIKLIYNNKDEKYNINRKNIIFTIIMSMFMCFILIRFQDILLGKFNNVDSLESVANTNNFGNSSYANYVGNSNSIFNFIIYTPLRIVFFLFSPLPFLWRSVSDIIAFFLDSLLFVTSIYYAIKYINIHKEQNINKNLLTSLLLIAMSSSFVFGWGVSNTGTACRHRNKFICIYIVLLALSREKTNKLFKENIVIN